MGTVKIDWLLTETRQKIYEYFDEVAELTKEQYERLVKMVDGPGYGQEKRQEAERETNPRQEASGSLAHGVVGRGSFYMNSVRRELEIRRSRLQMEIEMVDTALSLCTEEAEKTIQLQQILSRLDQKKY